MEKSIFTYFSEAYDQYRTDRESDQSKNMQAHPASRSRSLLRWLTPNGGTLLLIAALVLTRQVWAEPLLGTTNFPGPSATTVNYQGRLADNADIPLDGTYGMEFALYDAPTGGNLVWGPESHSAVPVSDGLFSVGLGSQTVGGIPTSVWDGDIYLEVTVGGETLEPRELIRSVPIAGMALKVPDGAIDSQAIASSGWGASGQPMLNFVPLAPALVLNLQDQSDIDYTNLDLTTYTSDTAVAVLLHISTIDSGGANQVQVRGPGDYQFTLFRPASTGWDTAQAIVRMDAQQVIQYALNASGTNTANLNIRVAGFWEPASAP